MFQDAERHAMELVETHADGADEWHCATCNRRFLIYWPPSYKRVILEEGDESAIHSGGKAGVHIETPQTFAADEADADDVILSEEMRAALNGLDWGD